MTPASTSPANSPANSAAASASIQIPEFTLGEKFTREQSEFLDEFGFIRFKRFASPEIVREIRTAVEDVDRQIVAEGRTSIFGIPLIVGTRADGSKYVQRLCFSSVFGPRLHEFLQDPRFRAILEIAGSDFRIGERERDGLVVNHFRHEPGSTYQRLGWHTDSLRDLFYLERPRRYLNVGFYIDDSPVAKGGVRLIPYSHRQDIWSMLTRKLHFMNHEPDPDEFALEAEAGDLTIHDGRIWHRVAQATLSGDASQRRVMYLPLMNGPLKPKDESSSTPFYFRLRKLAGY